MDSVELTVEEAGQALGVSRATVWRMLQRRELASILRGGRRLIPAAAVRTQRRRAEQKEIPALGPRHPIFRLVGAGRSGGSGAGARNKHSILDS